MAANDRPARSLRVAGLLGWAAATGREAYQQAGLRRMRQLRLTAAEREACADELAEQYALGRLDKAELDHRIDLLHQAVTHGDLRPVFVGLPQPSFYGPAPRPGRWRWVVFAIAAWTALPLVLLGLVFVVTGRAGVGAALALPALAGVTLLWRWAAVRGHAGRGRSD